MNYHLFVQISFVVLSAICLTVIYRGLNVGLRNFEETKRKSILRNYWIGLGAWIAVVSIASLTGFSANFDTLPPRPAIFVVIPVIALVFILRSKTTGQILKTIPPQHLINMHLFRIPVELLLWMLLLAEITPIQMTFEGRNFDILIGLTAPLIAYLAFANGKFNKKMAIGWNIFGLALLVNILVIAVLSMPTPLRVFMNEPANTEVAMFPVIFLPAILVPIAYYFHIFSLKQLLMKPE
ncbi:MAG: hypothetical protein ABJF04_20655 [Reichenbachiella sp.]|uniref:hypothetical protein n=1 Tax=Reichenbachiella sp. TaxID=2184521 RepID=UPI003267184D